jgi:hypothetical protein
MSGNCDFATLGPVMSCPLSVRCVGMYWLIPLVIRYGKVVEPRSWMAERIAAAPKGSGDGGGFIQSQSNQRALSRPHHVFASDPHLKSSSPPFLPPSA